MLLHKGKFLDLHLEPVTLPNGHVLDMEVIKGITASAVVPLSEDESEILLVRQYRPAANDWFWEIPCGRIESGEDAQAAAQRELEEETGFRAAKLEFLVSMRPCIGYSDETIHIYKGFGLEKGLRHLDDSEVMEVHLLKKEDVLKLLKDRKIVDPKTVLGLMYVFFV